MMPKLCLENVFLIVIKETSVKLQTWWPTKELLLTPYCRINPHIHPWTEITFLSLLSVSSTVVAAQYRYIGETVINKYSFMCVMVLHNTSVPMMSNYSQKVRLYSFHTKPNSSPLKDDMLASFSLSYSVTGMHGQHGWTAGWCFLSFLSADLLPCIGLS